MNKIEHLALSNEFTIYKTKYNGEYNKDVFIKRIIDNRSIIFRKKFKHVEEKFLIECEEFNSINQHIIKILETIQNKKITHFAKRSWTYTQKDDFNMILHNHELLEMGTQKTKLQTEWTSVFYIQIPDNLQSGEGNIIFMTEDKKLHSFTPKEKDIYIFSGKLNHMVSPFKNINKERIIYATNFNTSLKINI